MNPWKSKKWVEFYSNKQVLKNGLRLHFYGDINKNLKVVFKDFAKWLRKEFEFPVRVNVYIKSDCFIKAKDGDLVSATFWGPFNRMNEPYIKIAAGDYCESVRNNDEFNAVCSTVSSLAHELTHYYQWLNDMCLSEVQEERQAVYYSKKIVYMYLDERGYDLLSEHLNITC